MSKLIRIDFFYLKLYKLNNFSRYVFFLFQKINSYITVIIIFILSLSALTIRMQTPDCF